MGRIIVAVFFKLTTLNVFKKIDASENIFENSEDLISFGNKNLKAVQIFSVNGNKLEANWQNINNIFKSNKDVADYPLKIIVVCGQPRKGKSTICNLLYNKTWTNNSNFTGSFGNVEQNGLSNRKTKNLLIDKVFETGNGLKQKTCGIWITPIPITCVHHDGSKFNAFIIDVQGVFGSGNNLFISQKLFVLGALMASHLIYNVMLPFEPQDDELLKNFLQSTQTLLKITNKKPFQKLFFLFRDLLNEDEFKYGSKKAEKYIKFLKENQTMIDLKSFDSYFEKVEYYLIPKPNDMISNQMIKDTDLQFKYDDFGEKFMEHIRQLRFRVIDQKDDKFKLSENGNLIDGSTFVVLLEDWFNCVENQKLEELPNKEMLLSDKINLRTFDKVENNYKDEMVTKLRNFSRSFTINDFEKEISKLTDLEASQAKRSFENFAKRAWNKGIGSDNIDYNIKLKEKINNDFNNFIKNINLIKNLWSMYLEEMEKYLFETKNIIDASCIEKVRKEHEILYSKYSNLFKKNCVNRGKTYGIEMKKELERRMDQYYENIDSNLVNFQAAIKKYEKLLKESFKNCRLHERTSNKWIELDNDIYHPLHEKFSKELRGRNVEKIVDFGAILRKETNEILQKNYEASFKFENNFIFDVATGSTFLLIAGKAIMPLGIIGSLGFVGIGVFLACRWKYRPAMKKENIKD